MYADVAVCLPLSRTFVYKLEAAVEIGCRVIVPFRKREEEGFVVALRDEAPEGVEVHVVRSLIDASPLLRPEIFELCKWISDYYISPIGEVLKSALPPGITAKHMGSLPAGEGGAKRRARARMEKSCGDPALTRVSLGASPYRVGASRGAPILTDNQTRALDAITNQHRFQPILLHGVTGSGKTEIYMRAAEHFLAAGRTALILVPEIGLTPQLTERFADRFPEKIAILHSSLTKRQRIDEWLRIYAGEASIVIGTRSAVFAPLENLGLIVVDEEHETSYKQEEMPRYHARDTAVMRAKLANAGVVLGSATPSMESFRNAEAGKYERISIATRV